MCSIWSSTQPGRMCCGHRPFYFGIALSSVAFNVLSRVAVAGTPDITRGDMGEVGSGLLDIAQGIVALAGLIPVWGNVADGVNASISTARGNYEDAVLDGASAIPIGGHATGVVSAGVKFERGASSILAVIAGSMRRVPTVVQTGGRTIQPRTRRIVNEQNGVNFSDAQWHQAMVNFKLYHGVPRRHHGRILDNGNYVGDAGKVIGNLFEFTP